ncbi:MAG TPA: hypothetical protein GXZ98_01850 [Firmicutes bacterium]|jgi:ATP/maltotriose-dependent transcriptional regulator MalT|nr:hypothetical protein [Bacillota bacterium]
MTILDVYDNDPAVFFQSLIAGFQQFLPNFGKEAMAIIKQGNYQNNLRLILGLFINSLAQAKEKIGLVLDMASMESPTGKDGLSQLVIVGTVFQWMEEIPGLIL